MFAIKDLDIFKTHAAILTGPLFTAACITDALKTDWFDSVIGWLINHESLKLQIVGWVIVLLTSALFVWLILIVIDEFVGAFNVWVDIKLDFPLVTLVIGTSCIAAGLLKLLVVFNEPPVLALNPFWHLGFIAYGFHLLKSDG